MSNDLCQSIPSSFVIFLNAGSQHVISPPNLRRREPAEREEGVSADRCRLSAIALQKQGRIDDAIRLYQRGLALNPHDAGAYRCLGTAYKMRGRLDLAAACFRRAVELCPAFPEAWNNLGNTLAEQGDSEGAAESFRRAVTAQPTFAGAYFNLGQALCRLGRFDEGISAYQRAISLAPRSAEFHNGLGTALFDAQRIDESLAAYQQALGIRPDLVSARYNRSLAWLHLGDFRRGWLEYELRFANQPTPPPTYSKPRWEGAILPDSTILLDAEQGLGDTIQFVRYVPLVKERVGRVILRCQNPLVKLLRPLREADWLIAQDEPIPKFDLWSPLLSLPALFTPTIESIPKRVPYLSVDPAVHRFWSPRLEKLDGLRVGINWQGNPAFAKDRFRSVPLACFEPLARIPGVRLVSLQKGAGTEQIRRQAAPFPVVDLGLDLNEIHGAFIDTAALLQSLHLVVTVDSSLAHLAGSLGAETWVALPNIPDWRWLRGREDTPWYPTMRLFRQTRIGDWSDVVSRMAAGIRSIIARQRAS